MGLQGAPGGGLIHSEDGGEEADIDHGLGEDFDQLVVSVIFRHVEVGDVLDAVVVGVAVLVCWALCCGCCDVAE